MLDHMLDQLLFPLVLGPSFVSAQNPFPLKSYTLVHKVHEAMVCR